MTSNVSVSSRRLHRFYTMYLDAALNTRKEQAPPNSMKCGLCLALATFVSTGFVVGKDNLSFEYESDLHSEMSKQFTEAGLGWEYPFGNVSGYGPTQERVDWCNARIADYHNHHSASKDNA